MGKILKLDNKDNFTVTGILKDLPNNSRFGFEYLTNWELVKRQGEDDSWGNNSTPHLCTLLKENASMASANDKIKGDQSSVLERRGSELGNVHLSFEPLEALFQFYQWQGRRGLIDFVKLFGVIALFILLIACINFMNLSTARSEKRAKEVGIRKVVAPRKGRSSASSSANRL